MTRAAYQPGQYAHDRNAPAVDPYRVDEARRYDAEQGSRLLLERIHKLLERRERELLS